MQTTPTEAAAPAADIPALLQHLERTAAAAQPALTFYKGRTLAGRLTHGELGRLVRGLSGYLRGTLGIGPGERVAILSPNRLEVPVLMLALWRLGAVVVPLNPAAAAQDWAYILSHAGVGGVFCAPELRDGLLPVQERLKFVQAIDTVLDAAAQGGEAGGQQPGTLGGEMAIVLYTSGTTGDPKGVALSHRCLVSNAWSMARNFGLDRATQFAVLPLFHAHALGFGLMTALLGAGHLVFTERLDPFAWSEIIRAEEVTITSVVPTLLPVLLQARVSGERVPRLRGILVSSAPLRADLAQRFEEQTGIPLIQGWGLSEYTNFACCQRPCEARGAAVMDREARSAAVMDREARSAAVMDREARGAAVTDGPDEHRQELLGWEVPSIGGALEGTEVVVLDSQGRAVPDGEPGELCVRGHSTMIEYYRDQAATGRAIVDGWLHSGDEGIRRVHGGRALYFVTGRLKEIIIRGAEKYSPLAIERRLLELAPLVENRLVVVGFPHRVHGEEVGAYVELSGGVEAAAAEAQMLRAAAALPVEQRPKVILAGAAPVPRTHTGKVQRRRLVSLFADYSQHQGPARFVVL